MYFDQYIERSVFVPARQIDVRIDSSARLSVDNVHDDDTSEKNKEEADDVITKGADDAESTRVALELPSYSSSRFNLSRQDSMSPLHDSTSSRGLDDLLDIARRKSKPIPFEAA